MKKINAQLQEQLTTLIQSMGYEFVGGELLPQGRHSLLRIYIDAPKGVTIDNCSQVSRQISAMLDVEDPIQGQYTLEVSSPGIDRPLFAIEHYQQYVGRQVRIRLYSPLNQRRQFKGILKRVEGETIYLTDDAMQEIELPFSAIEKANLVGDTSL